jgi:hypothetical protein
MLDLANRVDPQGDIPVIAEMLSQCNEIYDDMPLVEANEKTGHEFVYRTSIPAGAWFGYYQGVPYSKSTTAKARVGTAMLRDYSQVDRKLAEHSGDPVAFRRSEDVAFLEGMSQTITNTLLYGNTFVNPSEFMGLSGFYNTMNPTAQNSTNVVAGGGGTGSSNTSLWLLGWGTESIFGLAPRASKAGLFMEDKGTVTPGFDVFGNRFEAYTSLFEQETAVCPKDWRWGVRLPNLDVTSAGLAGASAPDLFTLMDQMLQLVPKTGARITGNNRTDAPNDAAISTRLVFYACRTLRHWLNVQSSRNRNVLLMLKDYDGQSVETYRGIPIKTVDQISIAESAVTTSSGPL